MDFYACCKYIHIYIYIHTDVYFNTVDPLLSASVELCTAAEPHSELLYILLLLYYYYVNISYVCIKIAVFEV
jgi:hypothetical protein